MFSINSFLSKAAVAAALLFPVQAAAQCVIDKPAYMLYTDEGMPSSFGTVQWFTGWNVLFLHH